MVTSTRSPPTPPPAGSAWNALLAYAVGHPLTDAQRRRAVSQLQRALDASDEHTPRLLLEEVSATAPRLASGPAPPEWRTMLQRLLLRTFTGPPLNASAESLQPLAAALAQRDAESLRPLLGPALRLVIGKPRDEDGPLLTAWLAQYLKENSMADISFFIDTSSIPILQTPATLQALHQRVGSELQNRFGVPGDRADVTKVPTAAIVLGMVVLDGEVDPASSGLPDAMRRAWLESIGDIPDNSVPAKQVALAQVYQFIAETLPKLNGGTPTLAAQEFAFVAREVVAGAASIPFGHPNFESAIRIALDKYVETRATGDSLTLPPGSLPGGTQNAGGDADLNSDNLRVVGLTYSLALLEKAMVLPVADRLATMFMNGQMPFGHDAAGKALDAYYWDSEDRLNLAQRHSQYSRMLGMPGGEVSKEVAPNKDFEQLFLRFIASLSEFTRQREVDRMFTTRTSVLSTTGEQVRKCAFELAKNASLYGWGAGFYVATRINKHLERAIAILNQPQVLKTYAASNHWQVVERVAQQDFGGAPNWAKYSTMAQAANKLFDILARNTGALAAGNSGLPFLHDPNFAAPDGQRASDLSAQDTRDLLTSVQLWLAVNGVRDEQVKQYAQPVELTGVPSLPGMPGGADNAGQQVIEKLKQLTASGTPSPEQLQQLLATLH